MAMHNSLSFGILLLCLCGWTATQAQGYRATNNIPVTYANGNPMTYPWSGGMNNPHFSSIDLNLDGIDDLVFFDKSDDSFTAFLGHGIEGQISYTLAPEYTANFDSCECRGWALLTDFDCDGLPDIICAFPSRGSQFQVYKQVIYGGDSVGFEQTHRPLWERNNAGNLREIYNTNTDIPAIVDIDGDGDLDIVSSQNAFNFFALHRNMAMENFGRCDTVDFVFDTGCWGHFYEGSLNDTIIVGDTVFCKRGDEEEPIGGTRHAGSTLLLLDLDGNGLIDGLLGDVSYTSVNAVYNFGTLNHAFMDSAVFGFPNYDSAISIFEFPATFYVDLNHDGVRDLMVSPHESDISENIGGTRHYLNTGTDDAPHFEFQGRGLFSSETIDLGRMSSPTFLDYNGDGLMDLLVGSQQGIKSSADTTVIIFQMSLFKNVGTPQLPAFQLIDDDFLNASTFFPPMIGASPVAADIDGDGDDDLLIGEGGGTLRFFENAAVIGQPAIYVQVTDKLRDANNQVIDVGNLSAPELYDFDGDGDLDLFIGNSFGVIAFYENTGTATNPVFTLVTSNFGGIDVTDEFGGLFKGLAKPRFVDYDKDGTVELLVGAEDGFIYIFENPLNGLTTSINSSGTLFDVRLGRDVTLAAAPLDDSGELHYVIGSNRGGLRLWNNRTYAQNPISIDKPRMLPKLRLAPNPAQESVWLEWPGDETRPATVQVFTTMGQLIHSESVRAPRAALSLNGLPAGMYVVMVEENGERWVGRLVKE